MARSFLKDSFICYILIFAQTLTSVCETCYRFASRCILMSRFRSTETPHACLSVDQHVAVSIVVWVNIMLEHRSFVLFFHQCLHCIFRTCIQDQNSFKVNGFVSLKSMCSQAHYQALFLRLFCTLQKVFDTDNVPYLRIFH